MTDLKEVRAEIEDLKSKFAEMDAVLSLLLQMIDARLEGVSVEKIKARLNN